MILFEEFRRPEADDEGEAALCERRCLDNESGGMVSEGSGDGAGEAVGLEKVRFPRTFLEGVLSRSCDDERRLRREEELEVVGCDRDSLHSHGPGG